MAEEEMAQLSVKDRLKLFEANSASPSDSASKVSPVSGPQKPATRLTPATKRNLSTLQTTGSTGTIKQELLDEQSPTSGQTTDFFRPLQPTPSPQHSRPSTPASINKQQPPSLSASPVPSVLSLNSTGSPASTATTPAAPPPLPSRKPSSSSLLSLTSSSSTAPPKLPPRKATSLQASPATAYPPLPPRKPPTVTRDSWLEISHADVPPVKCSITTKARKRPVDPRTRTRYEKLFDAQWACAPVSWVGLCTGEPRLPGRAIKTLWARSGLSYPTLSGIWKEVDVDQKGCLARDAFVQGMWAVDEERRKRRG